MKDDEVGKVVACNDVRISFVLSSEIRRKMVGDLHLLYRDKTFCTSKDLGNVRILDRGIYSIEDRSGPVMRNLFLSC